MLPLIVMIGAILLIVIYLVLAVSRHDADSYVDQDRDPFYAESARLAAAGLLYEQEERAHGRPRKSYIVTPAGEAALRASLAEPRSDAGAVKLYFAGIVAPSDVVALAQQHKHHHEACVEDYKRILTLLADRDEWHSARETAELGLRFERFCVDFWQKAGEPIPTAATVGDDNRSRSHRTLLRRLLAKSWRADPDRSNGG